MGPVVSKNQFNEIQRYIHIGIEEGAELIAGGPDRLDGISKGYYCKPTVFANVSNKMRIAREEIFGPVLVIIGYDNLDDALALDRKSVVTGKSVSVRVYIGGRSIIKKKHRLKNKT